MNESTSTQRIEILLKAYLDHTASVAEIRELFDLLDEGKGEAALKQEIFQTLKEPETGTATVSGPAGRSSTGSLSGAAEEADPRWQGISAGIGRRRRRSVKRGFFSAAVVCVVVALLMQFSPGLTLSRGMLKADVGFRKLPAAADVAPGTNKAVLILGGGRKIWLDSLRNGPVGEQGNARLIKPASGQLVYLAAGDSNERQVYNSLETPRGGQFQVRLPDGTVVWLNASSTLRFPTAFTGKERRVELTGEAYFEVAKEAKRPFHVEIGATDIRVLGTHFNVMGYTEEKELRTTLLEGKVNVTTATGTKKLVPGNEAVVASGKPSIAVKTANTEQAVAWKNGYFRFHETGIREIMRQLERWYDVDVEFRTEPKDQDFTGVISRSENLSAVLQTLQLTGTVHFQIAGKKIVVLP